MQDGANILTLGENLKQAMKAITAELPVGIEITQVADQPHIVERLGVGVPQDASSRRSRIVLVVSFLTLGWRTGIVVALSVPLVLGDRVHRDVRGRPGPAPHHARRADHRARTCWSTTPSSPSR